MRFSILIMAAGLLFTGCFQNEWKKVAADEMIEYKLQKGQYAVVVVLDGQVTLKDAAKAARHRAAEIAVSRGYRYFLIQSETEIKVIKQTAKLDPDVKEMLVEGDFSKTDMSESPNETISSALRVVFQCFEKKPKGQSIKACNLTDCSLLGSDSE